MKVRYSIFGEQPPADSITQRALDIIWRARLTWVEANLLQALADDSIEVIGDPVFARYNAPFTPWFLRRNEVMVEIDWSASH